VTRATVTEVRVILPASTSLTDPQIRASIDAATCLVDRIVNCAQLTDACLLQVEIWLSAHYASATEQMLALISETDACSGGSAVYGFKVGDGIKGTPYGQRANALSGGCLAELDKQPTNLLSIGCL